MSNVWSEWNILVSISSLHGVSGRVKKKFANPQRFFGQSDPG
tara:strand:+ start:4291 stop:4416 length:126 start_codon:yes stop_codon:yes gene_type:complete